MDADDGDVEDRVVINADNDAAVGGVDAEATTSRTRFSCDLCSRNYTHGASLRRHMRTVHPTHVCAQCGRAFRDERTLGRHVLTHGRGEVDDDVVEFETDADAGPPTTDVPELDRVIAENWSAIGSRHTRRPIVDIINIRCWNGASHAYGAGMAGRVEKVWEQLVAAWSYVRYRSKVAVSVGAVLEHKTEGEMRYFHSSSNNATLFPRPSLVENRGDLRTLLDRVLETDLRDVASSRRPSTVWQVRLVTNVTFYVFKMLGAGLYGAPVDTVRLPDYILNNRHVCAMDKRNGVSYTDHLCFFRCLAMALDCRCDSSCVCSAANVTKTRVHHLYGVYAREVGDIQTAREFGGLHPRHFVRMERLFDVRITVFRLAPDGSSTVERSPGGDDGTVIDRIPLNLNVYENHFSLIKSVIHFTSAFVCRVCSSRFTRNSTLAAHACREAELGPKRTYPGGTFKPSTTIFQKLREFGVRTPEHFYPYRITYDIECLLDREDLPAATPRLSYTNRHSLLSVSVCSNVPDYDAPVCFIRKADDSDGSELVDRFVSRLQEIAVAAAGLVRTRHSGLLEALEERIERVVTAETSYSDRPFSPPGFYGHRPSPETLLERLNEWIDVVPVVAFNSQRYDLLVLKPMLIRRLAREGDEGLIRFVVKRNNAMTCLETVRLRFLDITNFIAPGFNYERYLRAYDCSVSKGFFPYEWMDSLDKLELTHLPPIEAFHSNLKGTRLSVEDYELCRTVWREEGMRTFADFLTWYNNLDVAPMLQAIERQSMVYEARGIDMLKRGITLPGLAVLWMFGESRDDSAVPRCIGGGGLRNEVRSSLPIRLFSHEEGELCQLFRRQLVGGPSIVFKRYAEKGVSRIRVHQLGEEAAVCDKVWGVDANTLYLYCMMSPMPMGKPLRTLWPKGILACDGPGEQERLRGSKVAHGWLEWTARRRGICIRHEHNGGEVRLGRHALPVDGFYEDSGEVFQFHGCFWHGHPCRKNRGIDVHPVRGKTMRELHSDTVDKENYLRGLGYRVEVKWECDWESEVDGDGAIKRFLSEFFSTFYPKRGSVDLSLQTVVERIRDGRLFGFVECDVSVPNSLRDKFSEMAPIFKNVSVGREHLGPEMLTIAQREGYLQRPQRMLIGSLKGKRVLLLTDLLRWYLRHGLIVEDVYQVVEYTAGTPFKRFGDSVSAARRDGDLDSSKRVLADTAKLVGNSCFGKTIVNKDKHRDVRYVDGHRAASATINNSQFESLTQLDGEGLYEVSTLKPEVKMDVPVHIGFTILQRAKLRMLSFYYDFMDRYVDRRDFEYLEMDTDSAYMALSGPLHDIVRPVMRRDFYESYGDWFPRPYCDVHRLAFVETQMNYHEGEGEEWQIREDCCRAQRQFDTRTPGLFKVEFEGEGMVALNSKTYHCWGVGGEKSSSKGLSKATNSFGRDVYKSVLRDGVSVSGTNKGFVLRENRMFTYSQLRTGLTFLYAKRRVLSDGVSTVNIDL